MIRFSPNDGKGWRRKGDAHVHRKDFIDSLFGDFAAKNFADSVKFYLPNNFQITEYEAAEASLIVRSKFKQLQFTGQESGIVFQKNYQQIESSKSGVLENARMLGAA